MGRNKKIQTSEQESPIQTVEKNNESPKVETVETPKPLEVENKIEDILGGYSNAMEIETPSFSPEQKKERKKREKKNEPLPGDIPNISGSLVITMVDTIVPLAISFLNNQFSNKKTTPEKLKMTEGQKNELVPLVEQYIREKNLQVDPLWAILLCLASIYGGNLMGEK